MPRTRVAVMVDEMGLPQEAIGATLRSKCPVKIGDRFYKEVHCNRTGAALKDYLKVIDIRPYGEAYAIRARYENHGIGPYERTFSSKIFEDESWKIVKE